MLCVVALLDTDRRPALRGHLAAHGLVSSWHVRSSNGGVALADHTPADVLASPSRGDGSGGRVTGDPTLGQVGDAYVGYRGGRGRTRNGILDDHLPRRYSSTVLS